MTKLEAGTVVIGAAVITAIAVWLFVPMIWGGKGPAPRPEGGWGLVDVQVVAGTAIPQSTAFLVPGNNDLTNAIRFDGLGATPPPDLPNTRINPQGEVVKAPVEDWLGELEWPFPEKWWPPGQLFDVDSPRPWAHA